MAKQGMPIVMSATASTVAVGKTVPLDAERLQAPYRKAMEIDEVHFLVQAKAPSGQGYLTKLINFIAADLKVGRKKITETFTPLSVLHSRVSLFQETNFGVSGALFTGAIAQYEWACWRPPVPIYVPPNSSLTCLLTQLAKSDGTSAFGNVTTNVVVTYFGRLLDETTARREVQIPYVMSYIGNRSTNITVSDEQSLKNNLDRPVNLTRLTARLHSVAVLSDVTEEQASNGDSVSWNSSVANTNGLSVKVSVRDSSGYGITRKPIPFPALVDPNTGVWNFTGILQSGERVIVELAQATSDGTNAIIPVVGLIGWRKEEP